MIDIQEKKNKIITFLRIAGPSLPVRIAKMIEMEPVFTSDILSELLDSKQIVTSHMRIGASPLYFLPSQKQKLEEHIENLKPIEKDAYEKLKEKIIIKDEDEEPAIRVSLRNLRDFAVPFKFKEKIFWKYAFSRDEEIQKLLIPQEKEPEKVEVQKRQEPKKETKEITKKIENIIEKPKKEKFTKNKTFLEEIEEFLKQKETKIISMEEVDNRKVIIKIESDSKHILLFAFNKKRIDEQEIIKCYRRATSLKVPYEIIIRETPTKKMKEIIEAYKTLLKINKL